MAIIAHSFMEALPTLRLSSRHTTFATSVFCTKGFVAQGRDAFVSLGLPDATRNVASVHGVVADGEGLVTTLASSPEKCVEHATQLACVVGADRALAV